MIERKLCIVNAVQTNFVSHVLDGNTFLDYHVVVTNTDKKAVYAMRFIANHQLYRKRVSFKLWTYYIYVIYLSKHNDMFCVDSAISYPVFLGKCGWCVNNEFLSLL